MFRDSSRAEQQAAKAVRYLSSRNEHFAHERHIAIEGARTAGLQIVALEDHPSLQDLVVTLHHAYTHTLQQTNAIKIIENHEGMRVVNNTR